MACEDHGDRVSGKGGSGMGTQLGVEMSSTRGGRAGGADDDRTTVMLVCMFCSQVRTITSPRQTGAADRIYWECFSCQKKDPPSYLGKEAAASERPAEE